MARPPGVHKPWFTLDRAVMMADLGFKLVGAFAAVLAIGFFISRPEIELTTQIQAFLDERVVSSFYEEEAGVAAPAVVLEVLDRYNRANEDDLVSIENATRDRLPEADLCRELGPQARAVYGADACRGTDPVIGNGRFYERLLLALNARLPSADRLDDARLRQAVAAYREAEFLKARATVANTGSGSATEVHVVPANGFVVAADSTNETFVMARDEKDRVILFESERGITDRRVGQDLPGNVVGPTSEDVEAQFTVDWESGDQSPATPATVIAGGLLVVAIVGSVCLLDWRRHRDATTDGDSRPHGTDR